MQIIEPIQLVEDTRLAIQSIRSTLIELYQAVGANPQTPQDVARTFHINRNLTWKLARVIAASDPFSALNHIPGQQGLDLALDAFSKAGDCAGAIANVRAAMNALGEVVRNHADDREHLELTLESMGLFERDRSAESGRELGFRGNSSVWGVQAKARLAVNLLSPGATPGTIDYLLASGIVGFRRLRPAVQWRLARAQLHNDDGSDLNSGARYEEIDVKRPGDSPLLIRDFCSPSMPQLVTRDSPGGRELWLPGGQVGNRATFDCFFGCIFRALPASGTADNQYGSVASTVTMPTAMLVFDLIVHRDVPVPPRPEVTLYGFPHGGPDDPSAQTTINTLPFSEKIIDLDGAPPEVANPVAPSLPKFLDHLYAKVGCSPSDFRGIRIQLRFPPMGSRLVMRWKLP